MTNKTTQLTELTELEIQEIERKFEEKFAKLVEQVFKSKLPSSRKYGLFQEFYRHMNRIYNN